MKAINRAYICAIAVVLLLAGLASPALGVKALNIVESSVAISGNPGATATGSFTVENTGTEVLNVVFSSTPLVFSSNSVPGPSIGAITGILPGDARSVSFSVSIPAGQVAGGYSGKINASDGAAFDEVVLNLVVNPSPAMQINPTQVEISVPRGFSNTGQFSVTNTGNIALSNVVVSFSELTRQGGSGTIAAGNLAVSANGFALNQGQSRTLTITLSVPDGTPVGTYLGNFQLASDGLTVSGTIRATVSEPVYSLAVPTEVRAENALRTIQQSKVFTITNNGNYELTGIAFSSTAPAKYAVSFENVPVTLAAGASRQVTVKFTLPKDEDTGLKTIGNILITSNKVNASIPFRVSAKRMLELESVDIYVDGKRNRVDILGGDIVTIKPESVVEVRAVVKNVYTRTEDVEIEDIVMTATIRDIDDDEDLEKETSEISLRADRKATISAVFNIPLKVDTGTYDLELSIVGEDENGAEHKLTVSYGLELKKDLRDLRIKTFNLVKSQLKCDLKTVIETEVINLGRRDEDEGIFTIKSPELGIDITEGGAGKYIELGSDPYDEDNTYAKSFTLNLPSNTKPGTYTIEMKLYGSRTTLYDSKTVQLTVLECVPDRTTTTVSPSDVEVIVQPPVVQPPVGQPPVTGPVVATPEEQPGLNLNQWLLVGLLGGIFLLALIIVIVLAVR